MAMNRLPTTLRDADVDTIVKTVVAAVWKDNVTQGAEVADRSGKGGGKTLFVSREGAHPPKVVFKTDGELSGHQLSARRQAAGIRALRAVGLVAPLLAKGEDWEISPFAGESVSKPGG